jgi:hypothetical protein
MNKLFSLLFLAHLVLLFSCKEKPKNIDEFLAQLPNVTIEEIDSIEGYQKCYKIMLRQKLDHFGEDTSTFLQKIYLSHLDFSRPMVMVTKGYSARRNYLSEPTKLIGANQLIVEHRYFNESVPDSINWQYLTIKQAAEDHHIINQLFKKAYKEKWISTGISKGGQTALYYKYFYPNDVDVTIPYVAPINFSKEEPRVYNFLANVGTKECRNRVHEFQKLLLENKDKLLPLFINYTTENEMTFKMGYKAAFEYSVLEFSFAFWQWGDLACEDIPADAEDLDKVFDAFAKIGFSFFSEEGIEPIRPFFYQALTEIGFYSYDIEPFGELIETVKNPNFNFTLPLGVDTTYNYQSMKDVNEFLQNKGNNIIYIYGEYDPWSASAVQLVDGKTNALKMVKKEGSHKMRINNFDADEQQKIIDSLKNWLKMPIELD